MVFPLMQPYRTTPLILPGAKVKKEVVPTECYLRHHPNPSIRARALHADDQLKFKVIQIFAIRFEANCTL